MASTYINPSDSRLADAADWLVRLQSDSLTPEDALAFDAWLDSDAAHGAAFDAVVAAAREYEQAASQVLSGLSGRSAPAVWGRRMIVGGALAAAAAAAAFVIAPEFTRPQPEIFETARGEHRQITLKDGATIHMNGGARLTVAYDRKARNVVLDRGEAIFDVTHDLDRPFVVAAGDRRVRVVGTQFDVRRLGGKVSVTVARGAVEVHPASGEGEAFRLRPGQRLDHVEGGAEAQVTAVEPADVMAWRVGRLILRERALGDVVADINQQFATPIRIDDPALAAMPVSGVLVLDHQDAVIRRLALLAPIRTVRSDAELILRRDSGSGRQ